MTGTNLGLPLSTWEAELQQIVARSATIPGWINDPDASALARLSYELRGGPAIAEIGVFMGRTTALLAAPRRLRGSGRIHCVDPFDGSGDPFSVGHYREALARCKGRQLEQIFRSHLHSLDLIDWVTVHVGRAQDVAAGWEESLDLLLLDGDQSPEGARQAFLAWIRHLKPGGFLVLRNTADRVYAEGHDGHRRLAVNALAPPMFVDVVQIGATTFAKRTDAPIVAMDLP